MSESYRRIADGPWDHYLRTFIFNRIVRGLAAVRTGVDPRLPFITRMPELIDAIRQTWQWTIDRVLNELGENVDGGTVSMLRSMRGCTPAGTYLRKDDVRRYCDRYAACPWCRYRHARRVLERLDSCSSGYTHVSRCTFYHRVDTHDWMRECLSSRQRLLTSMCKKTRDWGCDCVVTVPSYDLRAESWVLGTSIIALSSGKTPSRMPEEAILNMMDGLRTRAVYGGVWHHREYSKRALAFTVLHAMAYSPNLLYRDLDANEFVRIAMLTRGIRTSFHGVPRQCRKLLRRPQDPTPSPLPPSTPGDQPC